MSGNHVALMARLPELGKVKTRLAKVLNDKQALIIYENLLNNVLQKCSPLQNEYQLGVFVTPPEQTILFSDQYSLLSFYESQSNGDLGERMNSALTILFEKYQSVKAVLIGADIPDLDKYKIQQAFDLLESNDIVFGPTDDGGYYLIGMKVLYSTLFKDIDWGTNTVLSDSIAIADVNNLSYSLLDHLSDLDTIDDLQKFDWLR